MSRPGYILGIDTSNYTTSVAIVDIGGEVIANIKEPLPVKHGECGLRQSEAVFSHVKNLPGVMRRAEKFLAGGEILAVGVSEKPRNAEGSYMPCFLSGVAAAESVSAALGVPIYRFSHQCGHIMAAHYSSGANLLSSEFAAFHVSGGTTELLRVVPHKHSFLCEKVGGSSDLNAGQAIDRVGVMMGLSFPAGAELERLAKENTRKIPKKRPAVNGTLVSLSGLENLAEALYRESGDKALASAFTLDYIGKALALLRDAYTQKYGAARFLFAGGVMSNSIIKEILKREDSYFSEPKLSADNAVGVALLSHRQYLSEKN